MRVCKLSIALIAVGLSIPAFADDACGRECQTTLIDEFHRGIDAILRRGSSAQDIDGLLEPLHDDVRYIHTEYSADFDKETWRAAFLRALHAGRYNGGPGDGTTIQKIIFGDSHVAVETIVRSTRDGKLRVSEPRLRLFGFTDGKISLVRDFWR